MSTSNGVFVILAICRVSDGAGRMGSFLIVGRVGITIFGYEIGVD